MQHPFASDCDFALNASLPWPSLLPTTGAISPASFAEDWWREIEMGIEGGDSFICVISEHWLTSEICHKELARARQNNKHVLPLIRQPIVFLLFIDERLFRPRPLPAMHVSLYGNFIGLFQSTISAELLPGLSTSIFVWPLLTL